MISALFSKPLASSPASSRPKQSPPSLGLFALVDPQGYAQKVAQESLDRELENEPAVEFQPAKAGPVEDEGFLNFLERITPAWNWRWPHLQAAQEALDKVTSGEITRLMILMPPRHGKSEQTTVRYPVYRLKLDPSIRVCVGGYSQDFANRFGRKAYRIAKGVLNVAQDRRAAKEWETVEGGVYRSCGVGSPPTGEGFHILLIDDPIKSREEANSVAYRNRCWDWYTDDLLSRMEPGGAIILIMTCWHEDDLAGRILASEEGKEWTVVRMPAEAETQQERDDWCRRNYRPWGQPDPIGRQPGEALCPDRYPVSSLQKLRKSMGRSYYALYQQRPQALEGAMFKRSKFKIVSAIPRESITWIRYWDKAGTEGGGANTASGLIGRRTNGRYLIAEVTADQVGAQNREELIKQTAQLDRQRFGRVKTVVEQEPGSGGKESAESTVRNLAGFDVEVDKVTGDKVLRAEPLAAQVEAENVDLLEGAWNAPFLDEAASFPLGKRKDRIDAVGGGFNKLALGFQSWSIHG